MLLLRHNSTTWVSESFLRVFRCWLTVQTQTLISHFLMEFVFLLNQVSPEILCTRGVPLVARRRHGGRRESVCSFCFFNYLFVLVMCHVLKNLCILILLYCFCTHTCLMLLLELGDIFGFLLVLITMIGFFAWSCFRIDGLQLKLIWLCDFFSYADF